MKNKMQRSYVYYVYVRKELRMHVERWLELYKNYNCEN